MTNYNDRIVKMAVNKMGESVTEYYTAALQKIESGQTITWNWATFLFTTGWMIYRRMYFFGLVALVFMLGLSHVVDYGVSHLVSQGYSQNIAYIGHFFFLSLNIFWGLLGNKLYYIYLRREVQKGYDVLDEKPIDTTAFLLLEVFLGVVISFYLKVSYDPATTAIVAKIAVIFACLIVFYFVGVYFYRIMRLRKLRDKNVV